MIMPARAALAVMAGKANSIYGESGIMWWQKPNGASGKPGNLYLFPQGENIKSSNDEINEMYCAWPAWH